MKRANRWLVWLAAMSLGFDGLWTEAWAASETVGGITWSYELFGGTATVTSGQDWTPAIADSTTGAIAIPAMLGGCPVTSIGSEAFLGCCA